MVVAVALALHDEFVSVPWQELDGVERFHVFVAGLTHHLCLFGACCRIVAYQPAIVLVAVQFEHIDVLAVRTPCYVGEITVRRVACLQVDGFLCTQVIYAYSHFVRGHASHRILIWQVFGHSVENVHLRIVADHGLVHAVESQTLTVGTPKGTLLNAELVAVDALTIDDIATAVRGQLALLVIGCAHEKLAVLDIGHGP